MPPVTWMQDAKIERVIRGDDEGVLHLHGYWDQPESVVLGIRSYEEVLGNVHAQNILHALQTMRTLLFVGCGAGLKDPNFGGLLRWTGVVFSQSEYWRFRLAKETEVDELQKEHPAEQNLFRSILWKGSRCPCAFSSQSCSCGRGSSSEVYAPGPWAKLRSGCLPEGDAQSLYASSFMI